MNRGPQVAEDLMVRFLPAFTQPTANIDSDNHHHHRTSHADGHFDGGPWFIDGSF